jgi:hypothetical protein
MRFASTVEFFYLAVHKSAYPLCSYGYIQHPNRHRCYCPSLLLDENCPSFGEQTVDSYRSLRLPNYVRVICHMYQSTYTRPRA